MKTQNPKKSMDCLEKVLEAWRDFAPEATFGNATLQEFTLKVQASRQARVELAEKENEIKGAIVKRDNEDSTAMLLKNLVVNGVIGDPNFGPDSALYEAMGYVRKSARKSGLTRKKKQTAR